MKHVSKRRLCDGWMDGAEPGKLSGNTLNSVTQAKKEQSWKVHKESDLLNILCESLSI